MGTGGLNETALYTLRIIIQQGSKCISGLEASAWISSSRVTGLHQKKVASWARGYPWRPMLLACTQPNLGIQSVQVFKGLCRKQSKY